LPDFLSVVKDPRRRPRKRTALKWEWFSAKKLHFRFLIIPRLRESLGLTFLNDVLQKMAVLGVCKWR
jgi:hypothetical protein